MGICTTFSCFQTLRRENVALYTKQDFLLHTDTTLMVKVLPHLDFDYLKSRQKCFGIHTSKKDLKGTWLLRHATQAGNERDRN